MSAAARGIVHGPICGRSMPNDQHCGMPRFHRSRCEPEILPRDCVLCGCNRPCEEHEGCYSLGFYGHQDVVTITTRDQFGTETRTKCRRCGARFSVAFIPLVVTP